MFSDESVDIDLVFLTDSVGSVHGLQIHLRVEIAVVDNNSISCCQIDTQSSSSSRQKKYVFLWIIGHERLDLCVSRGHIGRAIDSAIVVHSVIAVIFEDIQNHGHLWKYKYFVITFLI